MSKIANKAPCLLIASTAAELILRSGRNANTDGVSSRSGLKQVSSLGSGSRGGLSGFRKQQLSKKKDNEGRILRKEKKKKNSIGKTTESFLLQWLFS